MSITLTSSPASADLITLARALQEPALATLNTSNAAALPPLISGASMAIERTCKRVFSAQDYSLHLSIGPRACDWIALPNFPVIAITRLACNPRPAMMISNTDTTTHQRATVLNNAAGSLQLTTISAGVESTTELSFSTYPTVAAIAAAITSLGSGWTATAINGCDNIASTDLRSITIALSVLNQSRPLDAFTDDLPAWSSSQQVWDWAGGSNVTSGWQLDPDAGLVVGRFGDSPGGAMLLRCDYRAGFETIPADIQQACARLAALIAEDGQRNSTVMQQTVGPYTQKFYPAASQLVSNPAVFELIRPYIDHAKTLNHLWP